MRPLEEYGAMPWPTKWVMVIACVAVGACVVLTSMCGLVTR